MTMLTYLFHKYILLREKYVADAVGSWPVASLAMLLTSSIDFDIVSAVFLSRLKSANS